ncbi:MAG: hypothetical protein L3J94_11265 [Gammaproteobacteria bacterium]|nr:hypothetical protein [Gammaproteobacteria bacterium]
MALINRVAISNVLNFHGDSERAEWSPYFRYECLDFRGQSTAVNLTNGGGKTTLAEAILAVLSRDQTLVTKTKKKFSPKSSKILSHIQVELIRTRGNVAQSDFLTSGGGNVDGDLWVFGMYGHRGTESLSYYYYPGALELCRIGIAEGEKRTLMSNSDFSAARKPIKGIVTGPRRNEWHDALAIKANLPQSTLKQMVEFQKRDGDDKSALLLDIKQRPGESYAQAFFYQVLAPAIMEGVMDREGEEGEVRLEDTIERAVYGTVKAKRDTEERRQEVEELEKGVEQLQDVVRFADKAEAERAQYDKQMQTVRADVHMLSELVGNGRLPGVPSTTLPEGLLGELIPHLVVEPGSTEIRILDRGIAIILGEEAKHVNQRADRNDISPREIMQVIDIACDLEIQRGGHRSKSYTINDAVALVECANSSASGLTRETATELLKDMESWFDDKADTNPYRQQVFHAQEDIKQLRKSERDLRNQAESLENERVQLLTQQKRMETNQGLYQGLADSGLFTDEELLSPRKTGQEVKAAYGRSQVAMQDFSTREASLKEHLPAWDDFVTTYGKESYPRVLLEQLTEKRRGLQGERGELKALLKEEGGALKESRTNQATFGRKLEQVKQKFVRISEYREDHELFRNMFGDINPNGKDTELLNERNATKSKLKELEHQYNGCSEGVAALQSFRARIGEAIDPSQWLEKIGIRRSEIAVLLNQFQLQREDFQQQRQALDQEKVAANSATRSALECLIKRDLNFKPLHKVVEEFALSEERKCHVLGAFSSLLFAPVFETESEAQTAAEILALEDKQVPVFLRSSFESYCRDGVIEAVCDGRLMIAITAGVITRPVECLLDPSLVEREKCDLDKKISTVDGELEALATELKSISDETDDIQLARRATTALQRGESEMMVKLSNERDNLIDILDKLNEHCSEKMLKTIRNAQEYMRLGGIQEDERLTNKIREVSEEIDILIESIAEQELRIDEFQSKISSLDDAIVSALPADLELQLKRADEFCDKGGPDFFKNIDECRDKLRSLMDVAQQRYGYDKHFPGAQTYLDAKQSTGDGEETESRLKLLARELIEVKESQNKAHTEHERLSDFLPELKSSLEAIDKLVVLATKKYRKIAQLREDIVTAGADQFEEHALICDSDDLAFLVREGDLDSIKTQAQKLLTSLEGIDIERKASDLRRAQKDVVTAENAFLNSAQNATSNAIGLKPVELSVLSELKSTADTIKVRNLHEGLLESLSQMKDRLQECESTERESRRNVTGRLAHLIEFAMLDLQILKSVVGENHSAQASHFKVDAKVLCLDDGRKLIESIVGEIDLYEKQRRERLAAGQNAQADESFHEDLRDKIQNKLYKNIFSDPKIQYVNKTIRASGRPNEFNENLSEGQKAALSLMWMIRLAEFAIERDAKRMSSRGARKKVRDRAENLILVDGLFSNLSDRHLIESAMAGIESTRGRFQLIGFIHNPHYQNDFGKFPVLMLGKSRGNVEGSRGWVSFSEGLPVKSQETSSIGLAHIRREPSPLQ